MTEDELRTIFEAKIEDSVGFLGGKLSQFRVDADKYYFGEPFGNEQDGRSQVVDRVTAEAIDGMMPALMRIFASGDETVVFEPSNPDTHGMNPVEAQQAVAKRVAEARQATDYVNWIWNQQNNGYLNYYSWFKDALQKRLGVVKVWWAESETVTRETYEGLNDAELAAIEDDDEVEITEQKDYPDPEWQAPSPEVVAMAEAAGATLPPQPTLHDVVLRRTRESAQVQVMPVPPDEFLVARRTVSLDGKPFVCHRCKKTLSELIEMGFDEDVVMKLPGDDDMDLSSERIERFHREDDTSIRTSAEYDKATREVWYFEAYGQIDFDGDGIAEYRQVCMVGQTGATILSNEEVDDHPFGEVTPIIIPHKLFGNSITDQTMDLQLTKSVILRQMLDNLYLTNAPMRAVNISGGKVNLDDLLTVRSGGVVRTQGPPGELIGDLGVQFVAGQSFPMLEYLDTARENRTGSVRNGSILDPNVLNGSATGATIVNNTRLERIELIARTFAETGVKRVFRRILELVCKHQKKSQVIRLRGQFVEMDPREWTTEMDMTVKVGLGTGDRPQQVALLSQLLSQAKDIIALQGGLSGPLLTVQNIYNMLRDQVHAAGFRSIDSWFMDPSTMPPPQQGQQQQQPNPLVIAAQAEMQIAQQKAENDMALARQKAMHQAELDRMHAQNQIEIDRMKAAAQIEIEKMHAAAQIHTDAAKTAFDRMATAGAA